MKPTPRTARRDAMPAGLRLLPVALLVAASASLAACGANPTASATPRSAAPTTPGASSTVGPSGSPGTGTAVPSEGAVLPKLFPLPPGVVPADGDIMLTAETARTAEPGKPYPYQLQHCGVGSPIDFDGSLWDVLGGQNGRDGEVTEEQIGELINAGSGSMTLVDANHALFRTRSGLILGLRRHEGPKGFQGCA